MATVNYLKAPSPTKVKYTILVLISIVVIWILANHNESLSGGSAVPIAIILLLVSLLIVLGGGDGNQKNVEISEEFWQTLNILGDISDVHIQRVYKTEDITLRRRDQQVPQVSAVEYVPTQAIPTPKVESIHLHYQKQNVQWLGDEASPDAKRPLESLVKPIDEHGMSEEKGLASEKEMGFQDLGENRLKQLPISHVLALDEDKYLKAAFRLSVKKTRSTQRQFTTTYQQGHHPHDLILPVQRVPTDAKDDHEEILPVLPVYEEIGEVDNIMMNQPEAGQGDQAQSYKYDSMPAVVGAFGEAVEEKKALPLPGGSMHGFHQQEPAVYLGEGDGFRQLPLIILDVNDTSWDCMIQEATPIPLKMVEPSSLEHVTAIENVQHGDESLLNHEPMRQLPIRIIAETEHHDAASIPFQSVQILKEIASTHAKDLEEEPHQTTRMTEDREQKSPTALARDLGESEHLQQGTEGYKYMELVPVVIALSPKHFGGPTEHTHGLHMTGHMDEEEIMLQQRNDYDAGAMQAQEIPLIILPDEYGQGGNSFHMPICDKMASCLTPQAPEATVLQRQHPSNQAVNQEHYEEYFHECLGSPGATCTSIPFRVTNGLCGQRMDTEQKTEDKMSSPEVWHESALPMGQSQKLPITSEITAQSFSLEKQTMGTRVITISPAHLPAEQVNDADERMNLTCHCYYPERMEQLLPTRFPATMRASETKINFDRRFVGVGGWICNALFVIMFILVMYASKKRHGDKAVIGFVFGVIFYTIVLGGTYYYQQRRYGSDDGSCAQILKVSNN